MCLATTVTTLPSCLASSSAQVRPLTPALGLAVSRSVPLDLQFSGLGLPEDDNVGHVGGSVSDAKVPGGDAVMLTLSLSRAPRFLCVGPERGWIVDAGDKRSLSVEGCTTPRTLLHVLRRRSPRARSITLVNGAAGRSSACPVRTRNPSTFRLPVSATKHAIAGFPADPGGFHSGARIVAGDSLLQGYHGDPV